jgi:N-formylmaleamate deformylase
MKLVLTALSLLWAPVCLAQTQLSFSAEIRGTGQPMILIPGLESPGEVWQNLIEAYESKYQIHSLTLAGFAGAPAVPGLGLAKVKDDIVSYIRNNKLVKPVIVGHSLGGFMAFWIGSSEPDLAGEIISVDGLPFLPALMDPSTTVAESRIQAEQMRAFYASLKPEQVRNMAKMSLAQMISDPKVAASAVKWAERSDSAFVGQALYDLMTTDLRPELAKLRSPVLLVGAGKAYSSNPAQLARIGAAYEAQVAKAPQHRVVMAEHALHFIMLDDPEFLIHAIGQFLGGR